MINNPCAISSRDTSIRTDDRVSGSEHQRYVFVGLLKDLQDLGSKTLKEHWWYRANRWFSATNAAMNPDRQKDWRYLMRRAVEYRRRNEV
jgi:hypothetical protein